MIEFPFWLVLSLFAVLFWGIGEILTKKATGVLRAPTMLLFYAWAALIVWGGYWYLKGHPLMPLTSIATIAGVIASICFAIGMIFYYEALDTRFSKISIVSPITGAFPAITVLLAVIFLNENFHILAAFGILSVICGTILLGIKELGKRYNKKIYFLSFFCLILWSFGDVLAKDSIDKSSHIYFMLLYFLIGFVIWNLYYKFTYSKKLKPYLFSIDAPLVEENLNKGVISEELNNMFKTKGFPLSENATIRKEKEYKWEITNGEKIYSVKKGKGKLNIYPMPLNYKAGITCGVLSVALFTVGSIFLYLAFESGLVSLVSPITSGYPILTVVIAHLLLKKYLFSMGTGIEEIINNLNNRIISEGLKDRFKIEGFPLSKKINLTKNEDKWVITNEESYAVRKGDGKLNIYLKEKLTTNQKIAITLFIFGTILIGVAQ